MATRKTTTKKAKTVQEQLSAHIGDIARLLNSNKSAFTPTSVEAVRLMLTAIEVIANSRAKEYGDFANNCAIAAATAGVSMKQVADSLIGIKRARFTHDASNYDTQIDWVAYTALRAALENLPDESK